MTRFSEIRDYLFQVIYGGNKNYKFANTLTLNGFLVAKPNVYETATGREFIIFTLMQLRPSGNARYFTCYSSEKGVMDSLLKAEYVCFVNILAKVQRVKHKTLQAQVESIEIAYDFPNFEILPALDIQEFRKKKGVYQSDELEDED